MKQVKKRNGSIVDFEEGKITEAMRKAFEAMYVPVGDEKLEEMTGTVIAQIEANFSNATPSVEHVQDYVEMILMKEGYLKVAKHYIVYRYEHTKIREEKQQEVLEKIEENVLKIKTRSGRDIPFSEEKVRQNLMRFVKGHEDIVDVDYILNQLKYEIFEGMSTDEVQRALTAVVRSMIERDPAYSKVAAKLLLNRLYGDVFGSDFKTENLAAEHERAV
ncbi:MAG: ATP cone domain-containing protein, partial [Patescibacteria group bacterium]